MNEQNNSANDYALAKYLNERVVVIFELVAYASDDVADLKAINRSYVLLVNELKEIYSRTTELNKIEDMICWRTFEALDAIEPDRLDEYDEQYTNSSLLHISKVNTLCIIAGKEKPELSPHLKKTLNDATQTMVDFTQRLNELRTAIQDWYIPSYNLTYKYGAIIVNDVLKLKKAHDGSTLDKLMQQALESPNKTFKPLLNTKRTIGTILSSAGFTPTLRQLFFPEAGKSRGVLYRPIVSHETASIEHIDTSELDLRLKELGAITQSL